VIFTDAKDTISAKGNKLMLSLIITFMNKYVIMALLFTIHKVNKPFCH